jgi:hypothetical protein
MCALLHFTNLVYWHLKIQKLKMSFNEMKLQVESTRADWAEDLRRLGRYWVWIELNILTFSSVISETNILKM